MKKLGLVVVAVLGFGLSMQAMAGDAAAGKAKAASCGSCHGANGIATSPTIPNLAGQQPGYLVKALKDYKSGARNDAMMKTLAAGLSDADMENIAAYYNSLK